SPQDQQDLAHRIEDRRIGANLRCDVAEFFREPLAYVCWRQVKCFAVVASGQLHQTLVALTVVGILGVVQPIARHDLQFIKQGQDVHLFHLPDRKSTAFGPEHTSVVSDYYGMEPRTAVTLGRYLRETTTGRASCEVAPEVHT